MARMWNVCDTQIIWKSRLKMVGLKFMDGNEIHICVTRDYPHVAEPRLFQSFIFLCFRFWYFCVWNSYLCHPRLSIRCHICVFRIFIFISFIYVYLWDFHICAFEYIFVYWRFSCLCVWNSYSHVCAFEIHICVPGVGCLKVSYLCVWKVHIFVLKILIFVRWKFIFVRPTIIHALPRVGSLQLHICVFESFIFLCWIFSYLWVWNSYLCDPRLSTRCRTSALWELRIMQTLLAALFSLTLHNCHDGECHHHHHHPHHHNCLDGDGHCNH